MAVVDYERLYLIGSAAVKIGDGVAAKEIGEVADQYKANMKRVERLIETIPNLVGWSVNFQSYIMHAHFSVYGTTHPSEEQLADESLMSRRHRETQALFDEDLNRLERDRHGFTKKMIALSLAHMGALSKASPQVVEGLNVVMASVITGSWTAFEVLASDLWEATVNAHPDCMFEHVQKSKKPKAQKKPPSKVVELWDIKKPGIRLARQSWDRP
jgi:hypothetical protein